MKENIPKQGKLVPSLGLLSACLLVISSIVGSGVFKKVAPMSVELQSPIWVLIALLLAGMISLFGALSNAEIAGLLADSGGEYVYYRKIYNKLFAFLYGWASFTAIRSASIASVAYVFAQSFNNLFTLPHLSESLEKISIFGFFYPLDNLGVKALAIFLILFLTFINYRGLKLGEKLNNSVTLIVVFCILGIIIMGLTIGDGNWQNIFSHTKKFDSLSGIDFTKSLFVAMLSAFWAFEGWSSVGYVGGEIKNPQKNIPMALGIGVFFVIILYVMVNYTYLFVLPINEMIEVGKTKNSVAALVVVKHFLSNPGVIFVSILILISTFGCTNSTILMASRLYYKMSNDGLFFKSANFIHPRFNTPSFSLFIQAIWTSILVLSGSFDQLTDMLIFASFIFYGTTTLGVFILRYKMPNTPRPYKVVGYPIIPAIFIIFCLMLIGITLISRTGEALVGLILILTGLPFYFYWNRKNKV